MPAAIILLPKLVEGRDFVVQGHVRFAERETAATWHQHTWMEVAGRIYDPTLIQFRCLRTFNPRRVHRKTFLRHGIEEWRSLILKQDLLWWVARVREFGGCLSLSDDDGLVFHSHPEIGEEMSFPPPSTSCAVV